MKLLPIIKKCGIKNFKMFKSKNIKVVDTMFSFPLITINNLETIERLSKRTNSTIYHFKNKNTGIHYAAKLWKPFNFSSIVIPGF